MYLLCAFWFSKWNNNKTFCPCLNRDHLSFFRHTVVYRCSGFFDLLCLEYWNFNRTSIQWWARKPEENYIHGFFTFDKLESCANIWFLYTLGKQALIGRTQFSARIIENFTYTEYHLISTTVKFLVLVVLMFSQNLSTNGPYVVLNFCKFWGKSLHCYKMYMWNQKLCII